MEGKVNSLHFSEQARTHSLIAGFYFQLCCCIIYIFIVGTSDQKGRLCDIRSGSTSHSLIGIQEDFICKYKLLIRTHRSDMGNKMESIE